MRTRLMAAIALCLALAGAFWWLDFRAAASWNEVSSEVATASNGGAATALRTDTSRTLWIYVAGDEKLSRSLEEGLVEHLDLRPYFGRVERVETLSEAVDGAILAVESGQRDWLWTPVYGRAKVSVRLAFSRNGDISWRHEQALHLTNEEPAVMTRGTYEIRDSTAGVISRAAYQSHLGAQLATAIGKSLAAELERVAQATGSETQSSSPIPEVTRTRTRQATVTECLLPMLERLPAIRP